MTPRPTTPRIGFGIALLSTCLITIELALTRLFSVTIWYHFAFLAISVALFGIGAAALTVHLIQHRLTPDRTNSILARASIALALVTIISNWVLLNFTPHMATGAQFDFFSRVTLNLLITFIAAAAPFFAGGFAISLAMTRHSRAIHSLYSWDLFGAGLGCLLVIPALNLAGAPVTLVLVSSLAALAAAVFSSGNGGSRIWTWASTSLAAAIVAFAVMSPGLGFFDVRTAKGLDMDRLEIEFNRWNSFSLVSVLPGSGFKGWGMSPKFKGDLPERKTLIIDMNAMTPLVKFDGDLNQASHMLHDLSSFVHHVHPWKARGHVCVIGAGGGRDVLAALVAGAAHVTGVEINPLIVDDVMLGQYRDYTGKLYERPDVTIIADDGRGVVRRSTEKFDIIHLSMVDTSAATAAGAYSLTENSLHTVEAFADYLEHLEPNGLLSVSSVTMPGLAGGAELSALAWKSLKNAGADPSTNVAVISTPWIGRPGCILHNVIVKPRPLTGREISSIRENTRRLGFQVAYLPGQRTRPGTWIGPILSAKSKSDLAALINGWNLDVTPATDDRPFFFYQNRLSDLGAMLASGMPAYLFGNGLFILAKVALIALAMVGLFLLIPVIAARKSFERGRGRAMWDLGYVACLGVGFMCVEIALIQKFTLYLGRPTYTLVVVLFVLLMGSGLGSRLFGRLSQSGSIRNKLVIAIGTLLATLFALWIFGLGDLLLLSTSGWPASGRIALTVAVLAPIGLLLGMPYPAGLCAVAQRAETRIPWLWGINSATSVLGSVMAVLISMHAGISSTLLAGTLLYCVALLVSIKVTGEENSR